MESLKVSFSKEDALLMAAAVVGGVILLSGVIWLFIVPYGDKNKAAAFRDTYDVVVKGSFVPLFGALLAGKVGYAVGIAFAKRRESSQ